MKSVLEVDVLFQLFLCPKERHYFRLDMFSLFRDKLRAHFFGLFAVIREMFLAVFRLFFT